jgi:preprotein translocase subunit YajC
MFSVLKKYNFSSALNTKYLHIKIKFFFLMVRPQARQAFERATPASLQ